jgi:hypothetical protein
LPTAKEVSGGVGLAVCDSIAPGNYAITDVIKAKMGIKVLANYS